MLTNMYPKCAQSFKKWYLSSYKFGKLYNEQLYLLYKTDQLTQVLPEDMNNLQLILSIAYLIAGVS